MQWPSNHLRLNGNIITLIIMAVTLWSARHHLEKIAQNLTLTLPLI